MNQSSDACLIRLLHDTLSGWLKFAKNLNEINTNMDQLEESIEACKSLAWLQHLPEEHSNNLLRFTLQSLNSKLQKLSVKESEMKIEFYAFFENFERKIPPYLNSARVHGQANSNVLPGPSCDSFSYLIFLAITLQEAFNKQCFFFKESSARHEAVKFLDEQLANEIQQVYSRFRSA